MTQLLKNILDIIRSDMRILAILAVATGAAALALWSSPDSFASLPEWVQPATLLAFIFAISAFLIGFIWAIVPMLWRRYVLSWRKRRNGDKRLRDVRQNLLSLSLTELALVSHAVAKYDRALILNEDAPVALSLMQRNIIRKNRSAHLKLSYVPNFEITEDAWLIIMSTEEFLLSKPEEIIRLMNFRSRLEDLVEFLPQAHPAVVSLRLAENVSQ
ncbi:super-infection exclusion protein B [Salipiger pallidus]|uniref:super-infection exclusion protein B n=1 Tax=Salipiger pallidus TaxID=1775170 RepID=UPI0016629967|nr:super-infection exclusion protein B [Salipiger pallidus]